MRFKQFLNEGNSDFENVLLAIKRDCTYFLEHCDNEALYRGIKGAAPISKTAHPTSREPKDSDAGFNFMFNASVDLAFNIPDVRKTSYYVTGAGHQAAQYGPIHFVFPIGEQLKFMWGEQLFDSYEDGNKMYDYMVDMLQRKYPQLSTYVLEEIFRRIADKGIGYKDYKDWLASDNEEMMIDHLTRYFSAMPDKKLFDAIKRTGSFSADLKNATKEAAKHFLVNSKELDTAISEKVEIAINSSGGYYSINIEVVFEELQKLEKLGQENVEAIVGLYGGNLRSLKTDRHKLYKYVLHLLNLIK